MSEASTGFQNALCLRTYVLVSLGIFLRKSHSISKKEEEEEKRGS